MVSSILQRSHDTYPVRCHHLAISRKTIRPYEGVKMLNGQQRGGFPNAAEL